MNFSIDLYRYLTVFSLNFSSVGKGSFAAGKATLNFSSIGKGSFAAGKAKNVHHRGARFWGKVGSGVRDMAPPLLGNLGAISSLKHHSLILRPFMQLGCSHLKTTI